MNQLLPRAATAFAIGALGLLQGGCGLLDTDELLTTSIPLTYELPITLPVAYPDSGRLAELQAEGSTSIPIVSYIPVPLGELQGADSRITSSDLVKEVRIDAVTMHVLSNTLTDVELQPFEIRIGEPGTQILGAEIGGSDWESATIVAHTPPQAPGFVGDVPAEIDQSTQSSAAQQIASLEFGMGIGTSLLLDGQIPEGGRADVRFTLRLAFVVSPFK